jgi:hypothetical protein
VRSQSPAAPYVGVIGDWTGSRSPAHWPRELPGRFPVGRQWALFRSWGRDHADRVTVVDLTPVVRPAVTPSFDKPIVGREPTHGSGGRFTRRPRDRRRASRPRHRRGPPVHSWSDRMRSAVRDYVDWLRAGNER